MESEQKESIRRNIESVLERIDNSAKTAGRDASGIKLIAVTKKKPAHIIKSLVELGIHRIGESYLNEALFKIDLLKELNIEWHMIGAIQKGKEKAVAANFAEVHSVDDKNMAIRLNKFARLNERKLPVYLEFNVSGEESKHGWKAWTEDHWSGLLPDMNEILDLSNLEVKGLMTMAPYSNNPQNARPFFKRLKELQTFLTREITDSNLTELSMGMSGDFEVAIEEGATVLRIGSALVGPR